MRNALRERGRSRPRAAIFPPFPFPPSAASGPGPVTSPRAGGSDVTSIPPPARSPFCVCGVCVVCGAAAGAARLYQPAGPDDLFFFRVLFYPPPPPFSVRGEVEKGGGKKAPHTHAKHGAAPRHNVRRASRGRANSSFFFTIIFILLLLLSIPPSVRARGGCSCHLPPRPAGRRSPTGASGGSAEEGEAGGEGKGGG